MSEFSNIIQGSFASPLRAVAAVDENPDNAARALELSQSTGVPAPAIHGDLEGFERQHKAKLAGDIVRNNPYLQDYIDSHPLAAAVSNDDYGNLDAVSEKAKNLAQLKRLQQPRVMGLPTEPFERGVKEGWEKLKEGWGEPGGTWLKTEDISNHRFLSALATTVEFPVRGLNALMQGTLGSVHGVTTGFYEELGGDPAEAQRFARDITGAAEMQMIGGGVHTFHPPNIGKMPSPKLIEGIQAARPWLENGLEPPKGIHPEIDRLKADANVRDLDVLDEALKEAQTSTTRERNPDMFAGFMRQHVGESKIGISGDRIAELYGEKIPQIDDNLLGWVPGIKEQLEASRATGSDIQVPMADWLARVDPALARELHDDIRVQPGNITKAELALDKEGEGPSTIGVDSPLAQTRAAASLEPLFSIGDRKLNLQRFGEPVKGYENFHDFQITDQNGKTVGVLNLSVQGKQVYVEGIEGLGGLGPRDFGPSLMRDLLRQVKAEFPEAESITGHRVSGARDKAGTYNDPRYQAPVVKFDISPEGWARIEGDIAEFTKALQDQHYEKLSPWLSATVKPKELYTAHEKALSETVTAEINAIAPRGAEVRDVIKLEGQARGTSGPIRGAYQQFPDRQPIIVYSLTGRDPLGTGRHEAIHHLRQSGFYTEGEWKTLTDAAKSEGWMEKFGIERRYSDAPADLKLEEAVAEGFRDWNAKQDSLAARAKALVGIESPIDVIFRRMKELLDTLKEKFKAILGHEPTWEELFESTHAGEIGAREGTKPLNSTVYQEMQSRGDLPSDGSIWGHSDKHPDWAKDYFGKGVESNVVYSHGQHAILERFPLQMKGKPFYMALKNFGVNVGSAAYDIRKYKGTVFDEAEIAKLSPIIDKLETQAPSTINTAPAKTAFKAMLDAGEERADMLRANATSLDLASYKRIQKLIEARHKEDIAATEKRVLAEQQRRQTKEWKDNRKELRTEVEEQIRNRPDVAADLFFGSGELYGKKLARGYRIKTEDLTLEQQAALPKHYQAKDGIPADEAAKLFGYGSGDAMVAKLIETNTAKGKVPAQEYLKTLVEAETDKQMEAKYGLLEKNIMEDAKDQALSETQLNILAEEMHAVGMQAGVKTIDADVAKAWVKDRFGKLSIGDITTDGFMRDIGRHGRDAERTLIAGKPTEAIISLQKKYLSALFANEARKLEKQVDQFDRNAKRFSKREVSGMEPEYTNFIHQILMQVEKPVRRTPDDLAAQIAASGYKDLESFVEAKTADLRELPVADFLYDPAWKKPYDSLSVEEFRAISDSVKALAHNARDELKIYRAGEAADFAEKKAEMMEQLEQFQIKHYDTKGKRWMGPIPPKIASGIRTYIAAHMQMEGLFNRWDKFDPRGVWNQYVMRDLVEGANQEAAWRTEFSKKLSIIKDSADLNKAVENTLFKDPLGGGNMNFTRKNLRTIMLNAGNESNMTKLAKGYGLEPKQVWDWINTHATKEDWAWAQQVGDLFGEIKAKSDTMYRSLTGGVAPEGIDIKPFDTPHGKQAGWYYPIMFHPEFEGKSKKLMGGDPLEGEGYIRATTPAGYTKGRTGYAAPLALDLDALPGRMASMLHDVAMRPAVLNAAKVMYDKDIRTKIAAHYGTEYRDLMVPYLRDVANSANFNSKAQKMFTQTSEFIRQNMISTLVGLNPGTVMKHGPTALVQSIMEVGPVNFLQATKSLFSINEATGESNWAFAQQHSQELQRRHRNYRETLSGATEELVPTSGFQSLRQTVLNVASYPVSISDLLSAVPTWLAKYRTAMEENGGIHGDAVFDADRAVRRAHGSTAITNRPVVMRGGTLSQWFASVYGFFNHIMNRQAELVWKTGDAFGMVKQGEYKEAMQKVPELSAMLFAYVIAPAIIEELVTPLMADDKESWGKKAAKGLGFTLGASWVGVRDITSSIVNGRDPSAGLISTAYQQISNLARDYNKKQPLNKEHAGKLLQDSVAVFGTATGLTPLQLGRSARFGFGVAQGTERPKGPWGWLVGMRYGTLEKHSKTFEEWRKHH